MNQSLKQYLTRHRHSLPTSFYVFLVKIGYLENKPLILIEEAIPDSSDPEYLDETIAHVKDILRGAMFQRIISLMRLDLYPANVSYINHNNPNRVSLRAEFIVRKKGISLNEFMRQIRNMY